MKIITEEFYGLCYICKGIIIIIIIIIALCNGAISCYGYIASDIDE